MQNFTSFPDFESASCAVLAFLHNRMGFELWMVTRTEGEDWIVLQSEDHGYGVKDGDVFRWADSFCSQMVQGLGPCIAPQSEHIPAYANAPIGKQVKIGAYVGVPISDGDGSLFGTLCAIDPKSKSESLHTELPLVELLGRLLSCVLASELKGAENQRKAERNLPKSIIDTMTGLMNPAGWGNVMEAEERRCQLYGHSACIVSIRIANMHSQEPLSDDAVAALAIRTSKAIKESLGLKDNAARLESDLYAIMGPERNTVRAEILVKSLNAALGSAGISAHIGVANRDPRTGMHVAFQKSLLDLLSRTHG